MGIGLGDILGSISPAYGVFTGKGLGGLARYLSPAFDIATLLGGHGNGQAAPSQPQILGISGQRPLASLGGPSVAQVAGKMPAMSGGANPLQALGAALQSSGSQDQGIVAPPQLPMQSNGLGAILAQILGTM